MAFLLIILDGLGDLPLTGKKTPLMSAKKTFLNKITRKSNTGLFFSVDYWIEPGSDTAHLSIFGYEPKNYYQGRGVYEVLGTGLEIKQGDICFRINSATLKNNLIIDRRAGRNSKYLKEIFEELNGIKIKGVKFILKHTSEHRGILILRGKGLSSKITDLDPHRTNVELPKIKSLDKSKQARFTAQILNKFIEIMKKKLNESEYNKLRIKEDILPANILLFRGAGQYKPVKPLDLKAACIAGGTLYKGIARFVGMDLINVLGATGTKDTNLENKIDKVIEINKQNNYDLIFFHIKATDNFSHDKNFKGKKKFIEKIDKIVFKKLYNHINEFNGIIITGDHSTPVYKGEHSSDPVPILLYSKYNRVDDVKEFDEINCAKGGLGIIKGKDINKIIKNRLLKQKKFGE